MLYIPGTHLGIEPDVCSSSTGTLIDEMRTDTTNILSDWNETLTVYRASITYNSVGVGAETWSLQATITGDWQPGVSGAVVREEAGRKDKSTSRIFVEYCRDILPNDKIYRSDGTFEYVNYVLRYEDHYEIRMKATDGQN